MGGGFKTKKKSRFIRGQGITLVLAKKSRGFGKNGEGGVPDKAGRARPRRLEEGDRERADFTKVSQSRAERYLRRRRESGASRRLKNQTKKKANEG